jgi:hypothetical protein
MKLLISEEGGFRKEFVIAKAVTRIGSSPANDLQLRSLQVSPFHMQILYTHDMPDRCKVVNLSGESMVFFSNGQENSLPVYTPVEMGAGDEIRLRDTRLVFELPLTAGVLSTSPQISAALFLPDPVMRPNTTLVGRIALKNEGNQPSCQFDVEVGGLPEDCYQVDPVPLMYPGAQEDVNIRFFHHKSFPVAGSQSVTISVTAPESYPGEQVTLQQGIYVTPVLEQGLQILDDMPTPQVVAPAANVSLLGSPIATPEASSPVEVVDESLGAVERLPEPAPAVLVEPTESLPVLDELSNIDEALPEPVPVLPEIFAPEPQEKAAPVARAPIPVKPKVVKTPSESFWDE